MLNKLKKFSGLILECLRFSLFNEAYNREKESIQNSIKNLIMNFQQINNNQKYWDW